MLGKLSIKDFKEGELKGKRIVIRVDFNVPLSGEEIRDPARITKTLPTLDLILSHKPKSVVILSHLGRPDGAKVAEFSCKPVAKYLEKVMNKKVTFVENYVEEPEKAHQIVDNCQDGEIFFFENTRFYKEEEQKDRKTESVIKFNTLLGSFGDVFIQDAFACCHRGHSSINGVVSKVKASGLLLMKEMEYFGTALQAPKRPFIGILGGAKVDTKITLIENLLNVMDEIIIVGGMTFAFKKVLGITDIGGSMWDDAFIPVVQKVVENQKKIQEAVENLAKKYNVKVDKKLLTKTK